MLSLAAAGSALGSAVVQPLRWEDLGLSPIALDLGFFTLKWYSLAYLFGILIAYWHLSRMVKAPGSPMAQRHADDFGPGVVGRLDHGADDGIEAGRVSAAGQHADFFY